MDEIKKSNDTVMVSVSQKYEEEIAEKLNQNGISNYIFYSEYRIEKIREKIAQRMDYLAAYQKAKQWMKEHTVFGQGILSADMKNPYPEVSGYFIPTLLYWGERELALQYAKWLCAIQKDDGSWYDKDDKLAYVFDTAQILKGLIAVKDILPSVDEHIKHGCDWMVSRMEPSGRIPAVHEEVWGDNKTMSELIHIYCLSPLREAGKIYSEPRYKDVADLGLSYYLNHHLEKFWISIYCLIFTPM